MSLSESAREKLSVSYLYQMAKKMHSAVPYRMMHNGFAFRPIHYYIEITRRCNLRCKMCQYIDWLENVPVSQQREGELPTQVWHNVIDQIGRLAVITFTGGEVFVRKDFMELLEHASRQSRTHFISNTTMLPAERAEQVVSLAPKRMGGIGFNFAGTSIEGPGDRHDEIRQFKGGYERSTTGIKELVRLRKAMGKECPLIHVTTVLQEDNIDVIHHMPKAMKEAGADVVNFVTEIRMFDLEGLGEVDPSTYNYDDIPWPSIDRRKLADALDRTQAECKKHGIEGRFPRMPRQDLLDYYDVNKPPLDLSDYECRNAWTTLIIGYKGDVYPCWIKEVGNVTQNSLKEIWLGGDLREFRQTCQKKLFATCPGCCFLEHKGREGLVTNTSTPAVAAAHGDRIQLPG